MSAAVKLAERFKCGTVAHIQELPGDVNSVISIYSNQMGIESSMMEFRKRYPIVHDRVTVCALAVPSEQVPITYGRCYTRRMTRSCLPRGK